MLADHALRESNAHALRESEPLQAVAFAPFRPLKAIWLGVGPRRRERPRCRCGAHSCIRMIRQQPEGPIKLGPLVRSDALPARKRKTHGTRGASLSHRPPLASRLPGDADSHVTVESLTTRMLAGALLHHTPFSNACGSPSTPYDNTPFSREPGTGASLRDKQRTMMGCTARWSGRHNSPSSLSCQPKPPTKYGPKREKLATSILTQNISSTAFLLLAEALLQDCGSLPVHNLPPGPARRRPKPGPRRSSRTRSGLDPGPARAWSGPGPLGVGGGRRCLGRVGLQHLL